MKYEESLTEISQLEIFENLNFGHLRCLESIKRMKLKVQKISFLMVFAPGHLNGLPLLAVDSSVQKSHFYGVCTFVITLLCVEINIL